MYQISWHLQRLQNSFAAQTQTVLGKFCKCLNNGLPIFLMSRPAVIRTFQVLNQDVRLVQIRILVTSYSKQQYCISFLET